MTYGLRNSLIIMGVWLVIVATGWGRFYMVEDIEIAGLSETLTEREQVLKEHQKLASNYNKLEQDYQSLKQEVDESAKLLVKARNADAVYSKLISLSRDNAFTYFNFITVDSTHYDRFGVLNFDVSGEGHYRNFNKFVNRLEFGRPLFNIRDMTIMPITDIDNLGRVHYSFKLKSLFDRDSIFDDYAEQPLSPLPVYTHNSFYPLIHDVRANDENMTNVEQSRLISVAENFVSMRDQNGNIQHLNVGDRVYLGRLQSVDISNNSATFQLNEGGILKNVTLVLK